MGIVWDFNCGFWRDGGSVEGCSYFVSLHISLSLSLAEILLVFRNKRRNGKIPGQGELKMAD